MSLRRFCAANRLILIAFLILLGAASGCNRGPWTLWDAYSTRFIDGQGRVVDHTSGDRTTSEGQAYAMFSPWLTMIAGTSTRFCNGHRPTWLAET